MRDLLYTFENEYRTWYCVRYPKVEEDKLLNPHRKYIIHYGMGYCSARGFHFRNELDRFIFLLHFKLIDYATNTIHHPRPVRKR